MPNNIPETMTKHLRCCDRKEGKLEKDLNNTIKITKKSYKNESRSV